MKKLFVIGFILIASASDANAKDSLKAHCIVQTSPIVNSADKPAILFEGDIPLSEENSRVVLVKTQRAVYIVDFALYSKNKHSSGFVLGLTIGDESRNMNFAYSKITWERVSDRVSSWIETHDAEPDSISSMFCRKL
jgi:hypothetical protein